MAKLFLELIPSNPNINFMGRARLFLGISVALVLSSVLLLVFRGLNYGVDFQGGTQLHVRFAKPTEAGPVRDALAKIDLAEATVQEIGEEKGSEFLIRVPLSQVDLQQFRPVLQKSLDAAAPPEGGAAKIRLSEDRMYVSYARTPDLPKIKEVVNGLGVSELLAASVTRFGRESDNEALVVFAGVSGRIVSVFEKAFGHGSFEVLQIDQVGPKVGKELRMQAIGAILISLVLILIYVWFRFEFEFAPGAVLCLFHDSLLILGIFSLLRLQFDLSIVAAVLTIIGFSVNDTIVVYDRIRENIQKTRDPNLGQVMNDSINQTLSRTLLTSGTVFMATLALLFFGGPITFNFALAFAVGIVAGSYSTIAISAPITLFLHNWLLKRKLSA